MFIGIDVGGTYTDAVLTDGKTVIGKKKFLTRHEDLLSSLLGALDAILEGRDISAIRRVVLSTTLVTNIIAEKKYPPVALILIPGPGLNPSEYKFDTLTHIVSGGIDYRGREIIPVSHGQIRQAGADIKEKGFDRVAVVGKFSCRNKCHELLVKEMLEKGNPGLAVEMGHTVSGQLNFPRRIATTMLTAATRALFAAFAGSVLESLKERKITAPAFILKADGGTLPLEEARKMPVETIFSGPAASTMGAMCLSPKGQTSVVVDIGGTTTDLALILSGEPLLASKGARVEGFFTHVRSFAAKSIPLGGDSSVVVRDGQINILPERKGPAYCMGGQGATPTDALKFLNRVDVGDSSRAVEIMELLAGETGKTPAETAREIVSKACQTVISAIEQMFISWEEEPAYRVWEIVRQKKIKPNNIVGVGGAAKGLVPDVAKQMGCTSIVPEHADVANALGAAVAQPTVTVNLRVDTEQGNYTVAEDGSTGSISKGRRFGEEDALKLAKDNLYQIAENLKIKEYVKKIEVVHSEVFNMVRGWSTTGKLYDVSLQTPRDILFYLGQGESPDE
ncbi:MAG: hydantoinase/oxoprolinase family protein [Eubacteriales bacterium]